MARRTANGGVVVCPTKRGPAGGFTRDKFEGPGLQNTTKIHETLPRETEIEGKCGRESETLGGPAKGGLGEGVWGRQRPVQAKGVRWGGCWGKPSLFEGF